MNVTVKFLSACCPAPLFVGICQFTSLVVPYATSIVSPLSSGTTVLSLSIVYVISLVVSVNEVAFFKSFGLRVRRDKVFVPSAFDVVFPTLESEVELKSLELASSAENEKLNLLDGVDSSVAVYNFV